MKKISILLLTILFMSACKISSTKTEEMQEEEGGIGPISTPKLRNYTQSEIEIGRRICSALKTKRLLFEKIGNMEEKFRMRGELKNCLNPNPFNVGEFTVSISNASATDFEYVTTTRQSYFKDVLTDQNGAMESMCDNLLKSDRVSNEISSGNTSLLVNFLISEGYDQFEVIKRIKEADGSMNFVSAESVAIITQKNQESEKFFGVEKDRIRYTACPTPKTYSYIKQSWLSALTPF